MVRRLAQGHLDTQLGEVGGIELATYRLQVNPLYLLKYYYSGRRRLNRPQMDDQLVA